MTSLVLALVLRLRVLPLLSPYQEFLQRIVVAPNYLTAFKQSGSIGVLTVPQLTGGWVV